MVRLVDKLRTLGEKNRNMVQRSRDIASRITRNAEAARQAALKEETPEE